MSYDATSFKAGFALGRSIKSLVFRNTVKNKNFYFKSNSPFSINTGDALKHWNNILEYSTDQINWFEWNGEQIFASFNGKEYILYLRGLNNNIITGNSFRSQFILNGNNIYCYGDIRYLLNYQDVDSSLIDQYCFYSMFQNCTSLITAPDLPSSTLARGCYYRMFRGCTSLLLPPELPATTVKYSCYYEMFRDCSNLLMAPELPATELAEWCYAGMFDGCSSINIPSKLPVINLPDFCYYSMFANCSSIKIMYQYINSLKYRIPTFGTGTEGNNSVTGIFANTGGDVGNEFRINRDYKIKL